MCCRPTHKGRHPDDYKIPTREEFLLNGKKEKGVVLRDPRRKFRTYEQTASAGVLLKEIIARMEQMLRAAQHLDHMRFIAMTVKRPIPAEEHDVESLETAKDQFENLVEQVRVGGKDALRSAPTTTGAEAGGAEAGGKQPQDRAHFGCA